MQLIKSLLNALDKLTRAALTIVTTLVCLFM